MSWITVPFTFDKLFSLNTMSRFAFISLHFQASIWVPNGTGAPMFEKKTYSKCPLGYDFQWTNQDELPSLHNKCIKTVCTLVPPAFMMGPFYPAPAPWTSSVHHCQKAYEVLRWGAQNWGCVFDFTSKRQYSVAHIIILEQRELKEMSRLKILISHSQRQRASPWVLLLW